MTMATALSLRSPSKAAWRSIDREALEGRMFHLGIDIGGTLTGDLVLHAFAPSPARVQPPKQ